MLTTIKNPPKRQGGGDEILAAVVLAAFSLEQLDASTPAGMSRTAIRPFFFFFFFFCDVWPGHQAGDRMESQNPEQLGHGQEEDVKRRHTAGVGQIFLVGQRFCRNGDCWIQPDEVNSSKEQCVALRAHLHASPSSRQIPPVRKNTKPSILQLAASVLKYNACEQARLTQR